MTVKWWCRISMQITATDTDESIKKLHQIMPAMAKAVAEDLGIEVRLVAVDNWIAVPYMEEVDVDKQI